ncbi:hypothetical protein HN51_025881 [Arachis hypogaea]
MENLNQFYYAKRSTHMEMHKEALLNARNTIILVAVLIATVTFGAGIAPSGGVYQEGPMKGSQWDAVAICGGGSLGTIFMGLSVMLVEHWLRKFRWKKTRKEGTNSDAESQNSDVESSYLYGYHSY